MKIALIALPAIFPAGLFVRAAFHVLFYFWDDEIIRATKYVAIKLNGVLMRDN